MAARSLKTRAPKAPKKPKAAPAQTWGPQQEAARVFFERAMMNGVTFDTETTGLQADAEIWEIAVVDIATREVLLDTLVRPVQTPDQWEQVAWQMCLDGGMTWAQLCEAPTWEAVWPALLSVTANRGVYAWSGEHEGTPFDRRLVSQTCEIHGMPALTMMEFPVENMKVHHLRLRQAQWTVQGGKRTLENAVKLEGLKFPGKAHRALVDADAEAMLVQYVLQPAAIEEYAAVNADLNLLRRLRLTGRVRRDDLVLHDGSNIRRWERDIIAHTLAGDNAAARGWADVAELHYQFAAESRSGMYTPVPDMDQRISFSAPPPVDPEAAVLQVGEYVRMAQNVIWRYGKLAKIVDVLGHAPFVRYKVEFRDGAVLTYHDNCIEQRVSKADAALEGWK